MRRNQNEMRIAFTDISKRKAAEETLKQRTAELEAANKDMESFVYSISHDLRQPFRTISSFAKFLEKESYEKFDGKGRGYLARIINNSAKMSQFIEGLLKMSRVKRQALIHENVDMTKLASSIVTHLREENSRRKVDFVVEPNMTAIADPLLMEIVLAKFWGTLGNSPQEMKTPALNSDPSTGTEKSSII